MQTKNVAEQISISALAWLAENDELFMAFLGQTGAHIDAVKESAQSPEFLGFVLDFILGTSDEVVIACASAIQIKPEQLIEARQLLPGGDLPHWT